MGSSNSKIKNKKNSKVIPNSYIKENVNQIPRKSENIDDQKKNVQKTEVVENKSETNVQMGTEEEEDNEYRPTLKWHRANPKEEIVKIQQAAEIKDIEAIYENSRIYEIMNKMPDHFWAGRENQLPRYVQYRGDNHPNRQRFIDGSSGVNCNDGVASNLNKMKLSSMSDLSSVHHFDDNSSEGSSNDSIDQDNASSAKRQKDKFHKNQFKSSSCPNLYNWVISQINISNVIHTDLRDNSDGSSDPNATCLSHNINMETQVPKKGILKHRIQKRPISALITDVNVKSSSIESSCETLSEVSSTTSLNDINMSEKENMILSEGTAIKMVRAAFENISPTYSSNPDKINDQPKPAILMRNNHVPTFNSDVNNNNSSSFTLSGYFESDDDSDDDDNDNSHSHLTSNNNTTTGITITNNVAINHITNTTIPSASITINNDINSGFLKVNQKRKQQIRNNLVKRLTLRPTSIELTNRNILHEETESERNCGFEERKNQLNEKLLARPTINELKTKKIIKFNDFIEVKETDNYDRRVNKTWARLTEEDRVNIRNELNELKKEMVIHTKSRLNTRFHEP